MFLRSVCGKCEFLVVTRTFVRSSQDREDIVSGQDINRYRVVNNVIVEDMLSHSTPAT